MLRLFHWHILPVVPLPSFKDNLHSLKLSMILLLWKIVGTGMKVVFLHALFCWFVKTTAEERKHLQNNEFSFLFVSTCSLAVVEAQAWNASLVLSFRGGSKAVPWSKEVWVIEKKLESKVRKENYMEILMDGWRRSKKGGWKTFPLPSGPFLLSVLSGSA